MLNERHCVHILLFCAHGLWVLSFSLTDDLQDPVCYDIKLVLIV